MKSYLISKNIEFSYFWTKSWATLYTSLITGKYVRWVLVLSSYKDGIVHFKIRQTVTLFWFPRGKKASTHSRRRLILSTSCTGHILPDKTAQSYAEVFLPLSNTIYYSKILISMLEDKFAWENWKLYPTCVLERLWTTLQNVVLQPKTFQVMF